MKDLRSVQPVLILVELLNLTSYANKSHNFIFTLHLNNETNE